MANGDLSAAISQARLSQQLCTKFPTGPTERRRGRGENVCQSHRSSSALFSPLPSQSWSIQRDELSCLQGLLFPLLVSSSRNERRSVTTQKICHTQKKGKQKILIKWEMWASVFVQKLWSPNLTCGIFFWTGRLFFEILSTILWGGAAL